MPIPFVRGKNALYADNRAAIVTCSAHSTPSLTSADPAVSVATLTTATVTSSSRSLDATTSSVASSSIHSPSTSNSTKSTQSSHSPTISLQSIKAAWKTLTNLGFGTQRLPHLERSDQTPTSDPHQHDYRYTQFPTALSTTQSKKYKDSSQHYHHLQIGPLARSQSQSHRNNPSSSHQSPEPLTLAKCLKRHREKQQSRALSRKSKSDNALQRIGVNLNSSSDQNLHKVCLVGGNSHCPPSTNSIFSNVHLSGGSGDSSFSSSGSRYSHKKRNKRTRHPSRSRSLERTHGTRIQWRREPSPDDDHHTRSLERNHKLRIDLRHIQSCQDLPPSHPAPPPPRTNHHHTSDGVEDSGGNVSLCSVSSSNSSGSSGSAAGIRHVMEGGNPIGASFINKPPRGWLHPDQQLAEEGICYGVRYIGALEVNTSMKSLNFDTRSLIAKECISKVCEAAGLKTADRKRKVVKSIGRILGERPLMEHAGSNITLTITSTALTLTTLESCQVVACHEMPNISFASGGDPDTLDFIAYVAKDIRYGRACFVLECGGGLAQDVITTIGQAFELRFKEYLKRTPMSVQYTNVKSDNSNNRQSTNGDPTVWNNHDEREYYNDLPNKVPPDVMAPPVPPLPQYSSKKVNNQTADSSAALSTSMTSSQSARGSDNLIDFANEGRTEPEYVNDAVIKQKTATEVKDPFDMQPFSMQLTQLGSQPSTTSLGASSATQPKTLPLNRRLELQNEPWFHGSISRREAEILLKQDGDFLVRESQGAAGQYVLTGIQNNVKKHLLLVDPEGVVRTKSRTFSSVSHLIDHHRLNELPILSSESALLLRNAVPRL